MQEMKLLIFLKKGTFLYKGNVFKTKEKENLEGSKFFEYIENESKGINYKLFEKHFNFTALTILAEKLFKTKGKKKNNDLVKLIKVRWSDLKDEIEKMSEDEIEIEKPDKILKIVEDILEFIKQQLGTGLKILTPNQMLSRFPISLGLTGHLVS